MYETEILKTCQQTQTERMGICLYKGLYRANISVKSKAYTLGHFATLEEAMGVRADATEAKGNGNFDVWLREFKKTYKPPKRGKKTAKGRVPNDVERTQ